MMMGETGRAEDLMLLSALHKGKVLSGRCVNPLLRAGFATVGDITKLRRREVSKIPGLGEKGLEELDKLLITLGLSYREDRKP